jgi:hypothetical protein
VAQQMANNESHWFHFDAKYKFDRPRLSSIDLQSANEYERDLFGDGEEADADARTFQLAALAGSLQGWAGQPRLVALCRRLCRVSLSMRQ